MSYINGVTPWRLSEVPVAPGSLVIHTTFDWAQVGADIEGMVAFDGAWWACASQSLTRFDPISGEVTILPRECWGVTRLGRLLAVDLDNDFTGGIGYYDAAADVLQDSPDAVAVEPWEGFLNAATDGETLWTGGHSSSFLNKWDLDTGAQTQVHLEGFDTWIHGVAMTDTRRLFVLDSGLWSDDDLIRVHEFEPDTGAHLGQTVVGTRGVDTIRGLWCGTP